MSQGPRKKWKLPLIIMLVAVAVVALLWMSKPQPPKVESQEKAWLVDTETIVVSANHPHLSLLGKVTSPFNARLSTVISADVGSVPAREGHQVTKGQVLISLDKREINSRVQQRQADVAELSALRKAESNRFSADQRSLIEEQRLLKVAKDALARQQRLKSANLVAQERLEQAESDLAQRALLVSARQQAVDDHPNRLNQLNARLKRANAALKDAMLDLERSDIKSPFNGLVTDILVAPGERVQVGQVVAGVYDSQQLEVRAQLPDKFLAIVRASLSRGESVTATSHYQGTQVELTLNRIAGQTNASAGGVDAYFTPLENVTLLTLNSTLKLNVALPALDNTVTLPVSALYGTNRVYRITDERIEAVTINVLGNQADAEGKTRVIIDKGALRDGERIVTTQLPSAITGMKVQLRENASE